MQLSRNALFTLLCFFFVTSFARAQDAPPKPRRSGVIFTIPLKGIQDSGESSSFEGELAIGFPAETGENIRLKLDAKVAGGVKAVSVSRADLPEEYRSALPREEVVLLRDQSYQNPWEVSAALTGYEIDEETLPLQLTLLDGRGVPAEGFEVRFASRFGQGPYLNVNFGCASQTTGPTGAINVPLVLHVPYYEKETPRILIPIELLVHEPGTGQEQVVSLTPQPQTGPLKMAPEAQTALLREQPGEKPGQFYGRVLEPDGSPATKVQISAHWLTLPGRDGTQFWNLTISAGPDGHFLFTLPTSLLVDRTGQKSLPSGSVLGARLSQWKGDAGEAASPGLLRMSPTLKDIQRDLVADEENILRMPQAEHIRVQILDEKGQIVEDPIALGNHGPVTFATKQAHRSKSGIGEYLQLYPNAGASKGNIMDLGEVPVPGEYRVQYAGREYEDVSLEAGAGEKVLQLKLKNDRVRYHGKVIDAITGSGVPGAYLAAGFEQSGPWKFQTMPEADRNRLWFDASPGRSIPVPEGSTKLSDGRTFHSIDAVAKTDAEGNYEIILPPGKGAGAVYAWAPDRVGVEINVNNLVQSPTEVRDVALPPAPLYPAAKVMLKVLAPESIPDKYLREGKEIDTTRDILTTSVDFEGPKTWAVPSLKPERLGPPEWELIAAETWNGFDKEYPVFVPANVSVTISAGAPYQVMLSSAVWKDVGPFQGVQTLEPKALGVRTPFIVHVKQSNGEPAAGLSVRVNGSQVGLTDEAGNVLAWGEDVVQYLHVEEGPPGRMMAVRRNISIPEEGDEPFVYEVQLTPEEESPR